jgi:nitroimidazol reductase NimA-like FMN-containing flavoprotein (pyridoxamine 5'-phosphate oxidase superfamily)
MRYPHKPIKVKDKSKGVCMPEPKISRPDFPKGYVDHPTSILTWKEIQQRLVEARHYWICSVRPNQTPHVIPRWGVWINGHIYYDGSPETRHARNISQNPQIALHLESGAEAVILYGTAEAVTRPQQNEAVVIASEYRRKYESLGYAPQPDQWDGGGLFMIIPKTVIAWTSFTDNPTRFTF